MHPVMHGSIMAAMLASAGGWSEEVVDWVVGAVVHWDAAP
jgi:hypothetical protein